MSKERLDSEKHFKQIFRGRDWVKPQKREFVNKEN